MFRSVEVANPVLNSIHGFNRTFFFYKVKQYRFYLKKINKLQLNFLSGHHVNHSIVF
jgi:hypothetical protein